MAQPEKIFFRVAGKVEPKARPRATMAGHFYTPKKTVDYENQIGYEAQKAMRGFELFDCPLIACFDIFIFPPLSWPKNKRAAALASEVLPTCKPDIDNVIKLACDAMNKIVYVDDKSIVQINAIKWFSEMPRIEIHVRPISSGKSCS